MAFLLLGGLFTKDRLPPYPGKVVDPAGKVLFTKADILAGQDVYQRYGLMDHGSVWGHGSQRGPEFSANTLHLQGDAVKGYLAKREYGTVYEALDDTRKEIVDLKTKREFKTNRYDPATDFLRDTVRSAEERLQISRFFYWTAWVASTTRPGTDYSYTNNWPHDRSVGNVPTPETYIWSLAGILSLLIVLGIFIYCVHNYRLWYGPTKGVALSEKLIDMPLTPSQFTAAKFFLVVILLFLLQTSFGGLLAHYTIHPASFWAPIACGFLDRHHLGRICHLPGSHNRRD
jgi:nitric oxide reductase subunit B